MPLTPDEFADLVSSAVEEALTPVVARLTTVERELAAARLQLQHVPTKGIDGQRGLMGPPGKHGTPGPTGIRGQNGAPGPAGADGSSMLAGVGPPHDMGISGDVYLDTRTGDVYLCR